MIKIKVPSVVARQYLRTTGNAFAGSYDANSTPAFDVKIALSDLMAHAVIEARTESVPSAVGALD